MVQIYFDLRAKTAYTVFGKRELRFHCSIRNGCFMAVHLTHIERGEKLKYISPIHLIVIRFILNIQ